MIRRGWMPHTAQRAALLRLKFGAASARTRLSVQGACTTMGLVFSSRVGMAAGLDRYGSMAHLAHRIGLGFVETGTVTPRAEPEHNRGIDELLRNLERYGWADSHARAGRARLGISIARNSSTPPADAWCDFADCMERAWHLADYFALNLGSLMPVMLKDRELLCGFLERIANRRRALQFERYRYVPVVVKLQLCEGAWDDTVRAAESVVAAGLEGFLAVTCDNRTTGSASVGTLKDLAGIVDGRCVILSVGGIRTPAGAIERLQAGAALVQIHRALIWPGPHAARTISAALAVAAKRF